MNYRPEGGGRLTGKLVVEEDAIRFRVMYDSSFRAMAKTMGLAAVSYEATGGKITVVRTEGGDEADIVIPRALVDHAEATKKGLMRRVVIVTGDGQRLVFDRGIVPVEKIVAAING